MHIRWLPGTKGGLIQTNDIPPTHSNFNPSAVDGYIYIRGQEHKPTEDIGYTLMYNETTKTMAYVKNPDDKLMPNCNLFKGLEDLRIAKYKNRIWYTGTCTHASNHMTNELVVGYFNEDVSEIEEVFVVDIGSRPVKNVCPFVVNGKLLLLDIYFNKVYELVERYDDENNGKLVAVDAKPYKTLVRAPQVDTKRVRGSTSPVHLHGNIWGFVVHDIIFNDNNNLVTRLAYYHHWMEMDIERGVITFMSSPFWISTWGIEYVSGIRYDKNKDQIELFYGVHDKAPMKCVTTLANLRVGK